MRSPRRLPWLVGLFAVVVFAFGCATTVDVEVVAPEVGEQSPIDIGTMPTAEPSETPGRTADPTPVPLSLSYAETIDRSFASVEAYWAEELPRVWDIEFEPVAERHPYDTRSRRTVPSCGGIVEDSELYRGNAFYCEPDDFIAWDDIDLFPTLFDRFGSFAIGLVIAHEYGHAIQRRAGQIGRDVIIELQADCLAGSWTGWVEAGRSAEFDGAAIDLDAAIGGFLTFADPVGVGPGDFGAHGSAFDRIAAFAEGRARGAEACADYMTDPPVVALVVDARGNGDRGNDLPLDASVGPDGTEVSGLLELLHADLAAYLSALAAAEGVVINGVSLPVDLGAEASCGAATVATRRLAGSAFYCGVDDRVYLDRVELDELWIDAGDFAPSYLIAHAYLREFVLAVSPVLDATETVVATDCLVGVWARSVFEGGPPAEGVDRGLFLSGGDLDEGVVGVATTEVPDASLGDAVAVEGFTRVTAFARGFFEGLGSCGLG